MHNLHCLVEGNRVRGTTRLCDVEKRTVLNILKLAGENCERLLTKKIHNAKAQDSLELDENWSYVGCHQKRLTPERVAEGMRGDAYTFIRERDSPARFVSAAKDAVSGNPDLGRAGTSHVQRKNVFQKVGEFKGGACAAFRTL